MQQKNVCSTHSLYHPTTYISVNYLHGSRDFVDKATRASQVPREFANPLCPPLPPFAYGLRDVGGMFLLRGSSRQRSLGHSFSVPPVLDIFLS